MLLYIFCIWFAEMLFKGAVCNLFSPVVAACDVKNALAVKRLENLPVPTNLLPVLFRPCVSPYKKKGWG